MEDLLYVTVGRMVVHAAHLERALGVLAAEWEGGHPDGPGQKDYSRDKIARIRECLKSRRPAESVESVEKLLSKCGNAFERRNAYVHGAYVFDVPDEDGVQGFAMSTYTKKKTAVTFEMKPVDFGALTKLTGEFNELAGKVYSLTWIVEP